MVDIIKRILTDDYSAWGRFALRVYIISMFGILSSPIFVLIFDSLELWAIQIISFFLFLVWGMYKQNMESNKKHGY